MPVSSVCSYNDIVLWPFPQLFLCPFTSLFVVLLVVVVWCWMRIRLQRLCFDLAPQHSRLGMTRGQWRGNAFIVPDSLTLGPPLCLWAKFTLLDGVPRSGTKTLYHFQRHLIIVAVHWVKLQMFWQNSNKLKWLNEFLHKTGQRYYAS